MPCLFMLVARVFSQHLPDNGGALIIPGDNKKWVGAGHKSDCILMASTVSFTVAAIQKDKIRSWRIIQGDELAERSAFHSN